MFKVEMLHHLENKIHKIVWANDNYTYHYPNGDKVYLSSLYFVKKHLIGRGEQFAMEVCLIFKSELSKKGLFYETF